MDRPLPVPKRPLTLLFRPGTGGSEDVPVPGRIAGRWLACASAAYMNTVRIGYARVSGRSQDHQLQLDALAAADCREVVVETASSRSDRPKLRATLRALRAGDTLVIYKPDRIARSMKELLVLLEDELHSRDVNLHILTGICAGLHKPNSASIADKMLFMAAEMERDLIRERTLDGLAAAQAQGRKGGRPPVVDQDTLAVGDGVLVGDRLRPAAQPRQLGVGQVPDRHYDSRPGPGRGRQRTVATLLNGGQGLPTRGTLYGTPTSLRRRPSRARNRPSRKTGSVDRPGGRGLTGILSE